MPESLMDARQVAEMLGVKVSWVHQHSAGIGRPKRPTLPSIRVGRYLRYSPKVIQEWLKGLEAQPNV